jgi:hypothetical protein
MMKTKARSVLETPTGRNQKAEASGGIVTIHCQLKAKAGKGQVDMLLLPRSNEEVRSFQKHKPHRATVSVHPLRQDL